MNLINLKYKWMMVASKRLGNVGAFIDFIHLTHLAEPTVETHTLSSGEIFHPRKGTRKSRAILLHFWFHAHPIAKEARLGGTDVCAAWSKARSSCIQIPCRH